MSIKRAILRMGIEMTQCWGMKCMANICSFSRFPPKFFVLFWVFFGGEGGGLVSPVPPIKIKDKPGEDNSATKHELDDMTRLSGKLTSQFRFREQVQLSYI